MITRQQAASAKRAVTEMLAQLSIAITPAEVERIEIADFGLGDLKYIGLQLLTYINTERVCAKELIIFPWQTCPEHYHPTISEKLGKEETFRCRGGEVFLYVPGEPTKINGCIPPGYEEYFTAQHEIRLTPGEQYTILPGTPHWFQAGPRGAVVSEFSTRSSDELDVFTDPRVVRETQLSEY